MKGKGLLASSEVLVLFTYAPAGLGHLRVTDALYEGLDPAVRPLLLGSEDESIKRLHRLMSIHPVLRRMMEWVQRGHPEDVYTYWYRKLFVGRSRKLFDKVKTLLDQRLEKPKLLLVVATHYGLAHQLAKIKQRLWDEERVKMVLVLQVTDDSPQHIWYVPGADLVFVPSETTRRELLAYGKSQGLGKLEIRVVSYPVSPLLARKLAKTEYERRWAQVDPKSSSQIHVSLPIGGAAAGMEFFEKLIDGLQDKSGRFVFHVTSRQSMNTVGFLGKMAGRDGVVIRSAVADRDVVNKYQEVFREKLVALEITKPSEQAFKALYSTKQEGGCILLFAEPVGRQEYDNLEFLRRHNLIPDGEERAFLWEMARRGQKLVGKRGEAVLAEARYWRGLRLPLGSEASVEFVWWCLREGVLAAMMESRALPREFDSHKHELSSDGVVRFWEEVNDYLGQVMGRG